ncbi:MAG: T9SS type A sorting domain-containing protein, partial [Polaribacter sp.]|nr:T9SS type A sorting domain-containing protein [Polaribacter sp.]
MSLFGVSSVSNGGGSSAGNIGFTFPAGSATAGSFIYVASESTGFNDFFGFAPNYTTGQLNVNGDDSIELYENGQIIDVFGNVNVDGTGEPWEYTDGWAYRKSVTGPESTTFTVANWTYSGIDALDGFATNAAAGNNKFPIGTYSITTASVNNNVISGFAIYPNPTKDGLLTLTSNSADKKQVQIFNIIGKKVFSQIITGTKSTLQIDTIKTGIYIV